MTEKCAHIQIPEAARTAIGVIESAGHEAWVVGGYVRDSLMGRDPGDLDIAASCHWSTTQQAFEAAGFSTYETGVRHGTLTVSVDGMVIEVTTYRSDGTYSDGRHPDAVTFVQSIEEDLARRDFTMNALAFHPRRGLLDPYGGLPDIEGKLIRSVGSASKRFAEDYLRILRGVRFASQLGFSIEVDTHRAMVELAGGLSQVAIERQVKELNGLLCGSFAGKCLMENVGVLGAIMPELLELEGFDQRTPFHCYDVLEHTAHVMDLVDATPLLRWAALLHDVGKPEVFTVDKAGQGHFKGHPAASERIARKIAKRLRLPAALTRDMLALVALHDTAIIAKRPQVRHAIHDLGDRPDLLRDLIALKLADATARTELYSRPRIHTANLLSQILDEILKDGDAYSLRQLAISGSDLIEAGIEPGPIVGRLLEGCLSAVMDDAVANDRTKLIRWAMAAPKGES